jgi:hypothetical protein
MTFPFARSLPASHYPRRTAYIYKTLLPANAPLVVVPSTDSLLNSNHPEGTAHKDTATLIAPLMARPYTDSLLASKHPERIPPKYLPLPIAPLVAIASITLPPTSPYPKRTFHKNHLPLISPFMWVPSTTPTCEPLERTLHI